MGYTTRSAKRVKRRLKRYIPDAMPNPIGILLLTALISCSGKLWNDILRKFQEVGFQFFSLLIFHGAKLLFFLQQRPFS
jgi:hypothetical protein